MWTTMRVWLWIVVARWGATMFLNRVVAGVAGLILTLVVQPISGEAEEGTAAIRCANPESGTSWQIVIDYGKATVDAQPAKISQGAISWFDEKDGGNYTLDRKTGNLTAGVASSTGGYFRRARCNLQNSP